MKRRLAFRPQRDASMCQCEHLKALHWGGKPESGTYCCHYQDCKCTQFREQIKLWNWPWRNMWR